jgi:hypothetical protein
LLLCRADCEFVSDQIDILFAKLKDKVSAAEKSNVEPDEMRQLQSEFDDLIQNHLEPNLRDLKSEIAKVGNQMEKKEWRVRVKKYREDKKKMQHTMDMLRQSANREELDLEGGGGNKAVTNDEILQHALQVNNGDVETMKRLVADVADTQNLGQDALEQLHLQTEQIERINQDIHGFRGTVKRGGKLLAIYKRRIMTDRLIWIFMFIIVAGIVGLIIWTMVDPEGSSKYASVPEDVKPPTPDKIQNCYEGKEGSGCT